MLTFHVLLEGFRGLWDITSGRRSMIGHIGKVVALAVTAVTVVPGLAVQVWPPRFAGDLSW